MSSLPKTWYETTVAEITEGYDSFDPNRQPERMFKYIDIGSIDNDKQQIVSPKTLVGANAPSRARRVVKAGDTLFSTVRTYLKNIALVPAELDGEITSTGIALLRPNGAVEPKYLFAVVRSDPFISVISKAQDGTMYPAVSDADVLSGPVPLPPKAEQRRIVAKIESLSAKSKRAQDQLEQIPLLVARYKKMLLASAFRGKIVRMGDICDIQSGLALGKFRIDTEQLIEVPYLRVANVQRGAIDLTNVKTLLATPAEANRLELKVGDILMNEGGDRDKLGRGWVWEGQIERCIHQNHVFRARLKDIDFPPRYVSYYTNEIGRKYFLDEGKQTTNLASVSKSKIAAMPIPVPSSGEAWAIVRRIETAFAWIDRLAAEATSARALIYRLDQAVLVKAFRGELVPQDPADEPASVLLERIRAERATAPRQRRGRRPKPDPIGA